MFQASHLSRLGPVPLGKSIAGRNFPYVSVSDPHNICIYPMLVNSTDYNRNNFKYRSVFLMVSI